MSSADHNAVYIPFYGGTAVLAIDQIGERCRMRVLSSQHDEGATIELGVIETEMLREALDLLPMFNEEPLSDETMHHSMAGVFLGWDWQVERESDGYVGRATMVTGGPGIVTDAYRNSAAARDAVLRGIKDQKGRIPMYTDENLPQGEFCGWQWHLEKADAESEAGVGYTGMAEKAGQTLQTYTYRNIAAASTAIERMIYDAEDMEKNDTHS